MPRNYAAPRMTSFKTMWCEVNDSGAGQMNMVREIFQKLFKNEIILSNDLN